MDTDDRLHCAADGEAWCHFTSGSTECANGAACQNPNHIEDKDPWTVDVNIKRDRWGRYLLPDPKTGEEKAWTRVTTVAKTLDDTYNLSERSKRFVAYGLGMRDDLRDLAASADGPDDKDTLNDVTRQAEKAAAVDGKANVGTALHGFTQKVDRGDKVVKVPKVHQGRVERYKQLLADHGIEIIPNMIEVIVIAPHLGLAGTMDRGVWWRRNGLKVSQSPVVADLKSGKLDWSMVSIAQQEAAYAHSTHWWDGEEWQPLPSMNKDFGLVLHLPASGQVEASLHRVDIKTGYELLEESLKVREIRRSKGKHLFEKVPEGKPTVTPKNENKLEAVKARVIAIVSAGFKDELLDRWPDDVPTLKEGGLTDDQLDLVSSWCEEVEREHGLAA